MKEQHPKQLPPQAPTPSSPVPSPSSFSRTYSHLDLILHSFGQFLAQLQRKSTLNLKNPADHLIESSLSKKEQQQSAALMRINHAGEVCAQGLYLGQAFFCTDPFLKQHFLKAAREEEQHLAWCHSRLSELGSKISILSPFWYASSLTLGALVSCTSNSFSLGFLEETEYQVVQHLEKHLEQLPASDLKSRAILEKMQEEEGDHAAFAREAGAKTLPWPIPHCMHWSAKIMTTIVGA